MVSYWVSGGGGDSVCADANAYIVHVSMTVYKKVYTSLVGFLLPLAGRLASEGRGCGVFGDRSPRERNDRDRYDRSTSGEPCCCCCGSRHDDARG